MMFFIKLTKSFCPVQAMLKTFPGLSFVLVLRLVSFILPCCAIRFCFSGRIRIVDKVSFITRESEL